MPRLGSWLGAKPPKIGAKPPLVLEEMPRLRSWLGAKPSKIALTHCVRTAQNPAPFITGNASFEVLAGRQIALTHCVRAILGSLALLNCPKS